MKKKKIISKLEKVKLVVSSYYYGTDDAHTDKVKGDCQIALDYAIEAIKENKKLRKQIKNLKKKLAAYEC